MSASIRRIQYGRCSFVLPEGFEIQEKASFTGANSSTCGHCTEKGDMPVSLTLNRTAAHPGLPNESEHPEQINPDAYPVSITLITRKAFYNAGVLDYLNEASRVLQKNLKDFEIHYCTEDNVGDYPAARAQCSFQSNFRLFLLSLAWLIDGEIATSTMRVPHSGVKKGWDNLRGFVESVRL